MSDLMTVRLRTPLLSAVKYNGTATHRGAINKWIETGEYVQPYISTRDFVSMDLHVDGELMVVHPGDWIVLNEDGALNCFTKDEFNELFEFQNGR